MRERSSGQSPQHLVGEERVGVVHDFLIVGQVAQPTGGVAVVRLQLEHRFEPGRPLLVLRQLEALQSGGEPHGRLGQESLDLARQGAGRLQHLVMAPRPRVRRVVDEQDDPLVGVLLQCGREQRVANDARLFLERRHEGGQRRDRLVEELVDRHPGHAIVGPGPIEEPQAADQVGERGRREQADDEEVDDGLGLTPRGERLAVEQVARRPGPEVGTPSEHGHHDGQAPKRQTSCADGGRHDGRGGRLSVSASAATLPCGALGHRRAHVPSGVRSAVGVGACGTTDGFGISESIGGSRHRVHVRHCS